METDNNKNKKNKLFLKFFSDEELPQLQDSLSPEEIRDNIFKNQIAHIFLISNSKEKTRAYYSLLKKFGLHVQEVIVDHLSEENLSTIETHITEIYSLIKSSNCEIISFGDHIVGALVASLLIHTGKNAEDAIKRVNMLHRDLINSDDEIAFIKSYETFQREQKEEELDLEDVFKELELEIDERIDFNRIDEKAYQHDESIEEGFLTRFTIRTKMIFLISVIILTALTTMIFVATAFFKGDSEIRIKENNHNMAQMIASKVFSDIYSSIEKAEIVADIVLQGNKNSEVPRLLFKDTSDIIFMGIAEKKGNNLVFKKSLYNNQFLKIHQLQEADINKIHSINNKKISEAFNYKKVFYNVSPEAGLPALAISVPYEKEGNTIKSILLLYIKLNNMLKSFRTTGIVKVYLVNDEGDYIAHPEKKYIMSRTNVLNEPIVQKMLTSNVDNEQIRYSDKNGTYHLGSYQKLSTLGLGIIATARESEIFKEVYKIRRRNIIILLIILLISILLSFFFARTLSIPITQLARATQLFQLKNLKVKTTTSRDEINFLTQSFKAMVISILDNQRKLQDYAENLEEKVTERTADLQKVSDALWGEMQLATKIQTALLPPSPDIPGYEITGYMKCADEVGGDYYDVINTEHKNWAVIGDVSGHGVSAGLVMMMVQTSVQLALKQQPEITPSELLALINSVISKNIKLLGEKKYMTITVLNCDDDGLFTFAGLHLDLLIFRAETGDVEFIKTRGMWIGLRDDISMHLQDSTFSINSGDVLLLYTDGITESTDEEDKMFSTEKLGGTLAAHGKESCETIKNSILESLRGYTFDDDVTMLIIKKL